MPFLPWPATAIPLVAGGIALGLGDWAVVGGWLLVVERGVAFGLNGSLTAVSRVVASWLALTVYNMIAGRTGDERDVRVTSS